MKKWIEVKFTRQIPAVLDFLSTVTKTTTKQFNKESLILYDRRLINSGDRTLRYLSEIELVKYTVEQGVGIYTLKSDIFDIEKARVAFYEKGFWAEVPEQIEIF